MSRWTPCAVLLGCAAILPWSVSSGAELLWEGTFHASVDQASVSRLSSDYDSAAWRLNGEGSLDLLWRHNRGGYRFVQFGLGVSGAVMDESGRGEPDPSERAARTWVEWDLPFRPRHHLYRITLAALAERSDIERGEIEQGDRGRYSAAVMITHKGAKIQDRTQDAYRPRCELGATIFTYTHETFDDGQKVGNVALDRSDADGYRTADLEHHWVFGELGNVRGCFRAGPFKRQAFAWRTHLWGGLTHRDERARGEDAAAKVRAARIGVLSPLRDAWDFGLDGRVVAGVRDFERARRDEFFDYSLAALWPGVLSNHRWRPLRQSELRVGLSQTRVSSNEPGLSYNDRALFVSLDVGFGTPSRGGPITDGTAGLERRDPPSGPAPRLPSKPAG